MLNLWLLLARRERSFADTMEGAETVSAAPLAEPNSPTFGSPAPGEIDVSDAMAGASAAAPVSSAGLPLTPQAIYPPMSPDELVASAATLPFTDVDSPGAVEAVDNSAAESDLNSLLQGGLSSLRMLTPRTLEACAEEGLEPPELLPRTVADFAPRDLKVHLPKHHQESRHKRFEERRLKKVSDVIKARAEIIAQPPDSLSAEDAAFASVLVQERQKRAAESIAAFEKQNRLLQENKDTAAATAAVTAAKAAEADKRLEAFECKRQAALLEKQAQTAQKRELQVARIDSRKADVAAEHAQRAAAAAEHEIRRAVRIEDERAAQEAARHEVSVRKAAKAQVANDEKEVALEKRRENLERVIDSRAKRIELHAAKREVERLEEVKVAIDRHRKIDKAVCVIDQKQAEFAEKTMQQLETKGQSNAVREALTAQRQRAQAQRGKAVAAARVEVERQRERENRKLVQTEEKKEGRRQLHLASRAEELADVAEKRRARLEEIEERVRRQARRREHENEKLRASLKAQDQKFFAQRAALDGLQREKLAQKHKMMAEGKVGTRLTMREIEMQAEPGPTQYDNRFFTIGQLGGQGKFSRVGTKPSPPAYSFGNISENALPRVLDKALMIELVGQLSPGPNSASPALGSREVLDKTSRFKRSAAYTMAKNLTDLANKEALGKPGPGETHFTDGQLQMTRYNSAPAFSFATANFQELRKQELADLAKPKTAGETSMRDRMSFGHSSREPGPQTYDHSNVQTSLRNHRSLADGVGVSQRFAKANRFLPIDTAPKDPFGPTKFLKEKNVPGPQKYRPSTSFLSTPLAF